MFGIGGEEFLLIFVLLLIVAGPRRMIKWSYTLGVYTARLRKMWSDTMVQIQREINTSGVDLDLPKDLPTRPQDLTRQFRDMTRSLTNPLNQTAQELNQEFRKPISRPAAPLSSPEAEPANNNGTPPQDQNFGTWSSKNSTDQS